MTINLDLLSEQEKVLMAAAKTVGNALLLGIFRALATARAENKALKHEMRLALEFLEEWEAGDFQAATNDESVQGSYYMTVGGLKRALLQEKEQSAKVG